MNYISPNFTHEKLDSGNEDDLIDIFEDRMRHWMLEPALNLLKLEHGYVPAIALSLGYFEGIEIYCSGKDSRDSSKAFFKKGFKRVFAIDESGAEIYEKIINALYIQVRCGFSHDGLFRNRVFFSTSRPEAIYVTWPKKNGNFITDGQLESVVINPRRFIECIFLHFENYLSELRNKENKTLKENFLAAINIKWGINEPERVIGTSENEFFGNA